MKILLTGSKGQLGTEIQRLVPEFGFSLTAHDFDSLDITRFEAVKKMLAEGEYDLVMNAAAYNAVDKAEKEPDLAYSVNRDGPKNMAGATAERGIPLFHVSTDYVFSGNSKRPYLETDPTSPLGTYAKSKEAGEREALTNNLKTMIFRTAWLFSPHGGNFVKTIIRLAREKEELKVVSDQHGCPTSARDLAFAMLTAAVRVRDGANGIWGLYHFTGCGPTTWLEFAREIVRQASEYETFRVSRIAPQTLAEFAGPAPRPQYTVLNCAKIQEKLGIVSLPWRESLAETIRELYHHSATSPSPAWGF